MNEDAIKAARAYARRYSGPTPRDHAQKSLRDEFAMAAMAGLVADTDYEECAGMAYLHADAMMAERAKKEDE